MVPEESALKADRIPQSLAGDTSAGKYQLGESREDLH